MTLDGGVRISPEFVAKDGNGGKGGGTVDFLIASQKWAIELCRGDQTVDDHMRRFGPGGRYHGLLQSGVVEQYVVLNFMTSRPTKERPGSPPVHPSFLKAA